MIKKTITYTDYRGVTRTDDFYFNYSRAELIEMEASTDGGLQEKIDKIAKSKSPKQAMPFIKDIILGAYGIKSDDGIRFHKSEEIRKSFEESEAYSELLMEFINDAVSGGAEKVAQFINGLINSSGVANISALPKPETASSAPTTT